MVKGHLSAIVLLALSSLCLAKEAAGKQSGRKPEVKKVQTLSRGWGDSHEWTQTYEEALFKARTTNKPLIVINHREDCPHSQALKKAFAEHKEIQKLADQFILLNVVHDPTDKNLLLDGLYVPKIVFVGIEAHIELMQTAACAEYVAVFTSERKRRMKSPLSIGSVFAEASGYSLNQVKTKIVLHTSLYGSNSDLHKWISAGQTAELALVMKPNPSLVVRADLPGKYGNHRYTYEPTDMDHLLDNMKKSLVLLKTEL